MSNNPFYHPPPHVTFDNTGSPSTSSRSLVPTQEGYGRPDTAEQFLSPDASGYAPYRDQSPNPFDHGESAFSSRRSSWASDRSRESRGFDNPFRDDGDSRPGSRAADEEDVNTQTVAEKYNILPSAGLLLFPEDVEKDDYLHNPDPGGEPRDCNIFTRRGIVNVGGLLIITIGLLFMFIGFPAITFVRKILATQDPCKSHTGCIPGVGTVPLLKNVRTGLIDPDTPKSAYSKADSHGNTWNLVFSDEFSTPGRSFFDGDDPYFQAVDLWYGVTQDLEWYDPDAITTGDGVLQIRMDAFQNHNLNYRSGMLQSWNQMCFSGGRLEASISLPGRGDTEGYWPGFWALGNLGRAGHAATTDGMWPYSYDNVCDAGITPNQSSLDGINLLPGMRLPACTCRGEDHPNQGTSRSAPEIDVIEATNAGVLSGNVIGVGSQSYQVAPFDIWYQPNYDFVQLFDYATSSVNAYKGGPYQEALSVITNLNNDWYDGNAYQVYAFEYTPGSSGDLTWFVGDTNPTWRLDARAISPNGNVGQRLLPVEPMTMVLNFGISPSFSFINFTGIGTTLPATMRVDYIRIYQDDDMSVGCDPSGYPTTQYIRDHLEPYTNPNLTKWSSDGSRSWPQNTLMNGCAM